MARVEPNESIESNSESGIFLVGSPRSGTTLLQSILASHSKIFSSPETSFFYQLLPKLGVEYSEPSLTVNKHDLDVIETEFRRMTGMEVDLSSSFTPGQNVKNTYEKLLNSFNGDSKAIWIEKTTLHANSMLAIRRFYPRAKFVHIYRDPVDAVSSMLSIKPINLLDFRILYLSSRRAHAKLWNECVLSALRYPDQESVNHVCYEELLAHPQRVLQRVCSFLGIEMEPAMLDTFHLTARGIVSEQHCPWQSDNLRPGIATQSAHKWRRQISKYDVWLIQRYTRNLSRYLGYYEDLDSSSRIMKAIYFGVDVVRELIAQSRLEIFVRKALGVFCR